MVDGDAFCTEDSSYRFCLESGGAHGGGTIDGCLSGSVLDPQIPHLTTVLSL